MYDTLKIAVHVCVLGGSWVVRCVCATASCVEKRRLEKERCMYLCASQTTQWAWAARFSADDSPCSAKAMPGAGWAARKFRRLSTCASWARARKAAWVICSVSDILRGFGYTCHTPRCSHNRDTHAHTVGRRGGHSLASSTRKRCYMDDVLGARLIHTTCTYLALMNEYAL